MKVKIKNFQSIEEGEIEIEGFTVVVGKSNLGKSAVARAINGAVTNLPGESFVRQGCPNSEVTLDCPEIQLTWLKGNGLNDYVINGESFESVGSGPPPIIAEAGFRDLETSSGKKVSVQIAEQFSPIFLLDSSQVTGSVAAEVVSDIGRLGELQSALRSAEKDRRSLNSVLKVRRSDLTTCEASLKSNEGLPDALDLVERVRTLKQELDLQRDLLGTLEHLLRSYSEVQRSLKALQGVENVTLPESDEAERSAKAADSMQRFADLYRQTSEEVLRFEALGEVDLPEADLDSDFKSLKSLETFLLVSREAERDLKSCSGELPDLPNWAHGSLLEEVTTLEALEKSALSSNLEIAGLESELADLELEIQDADSAFQKALEEAGTCPLCEREFA